MLSRSRAGSAPLLHSSFVCIRCLRRARTNGTVIEPARFTNASAVPLPTTTSPSPHRTRRFATASFPSLTKQTVSSGITRLPHRRLVALSGPDAPKFLQGLTTNNVSPAQRAGWYTAFLNAQGRVLYDAFVYPTPLANAAAITTTEDNWACFIEVDADSVEGLFRVLKRHKLRSKVRIRVVDEGEWAVWSAWFTPWAAEDATVAATLEKVGGSFVHLADERAPTFGHRILVPSSSSSSSGAGLPPPFANLDRATPRDYAIRRYLHGVPEGPREIRPEEALPLESNVDLMRGVDFRKGCYVGQELTIRTKHTGVVRKRILPVSLYDLEASEPGEMTYIEGASPIRAEDVPAGGADIKKVADGEGEAEGAAGRRKSAGRSAGKWLAGVGNIGLALCRLEMMTDVKVTTEGMGAAGSYKPGMRFGLKWTVGADRGDRSLGIKAFVPEWHRLRTEEEARRKKKAVQTEE
ncbi:Glycine cleavage T-protein [Macrophomina phaseolina MS6]|uniref:Iron-sulfur cluster assembly factor IBA57 homolog, mitochondrial n=1 Tax=Macrophomina phaseolina (strain MS6) TaxID=1126212 RepID=K2SFR4_MACPH|nr:Glycine cleavage T-protein [Macrophomina phaseolina MS6]